MFNKPFAYCVECEREIVSVEEKYEHLDAGDTIIDYKGVA
jgi:hypothetical protein